MTTVFQSRFSYTKRKAALIDEIHRLAKLEIEYVRTENKKGEHMCRKVRQAYIARLKRFAKGEKK